jgi:hypothetical protein
MSNIAETPWVTRCVGRPDFLSHLADPAKCDINTVISAAVANVLTLATHTLRKGESATVFLYDGYALTISHNAQTDSLEAILQESNMPDPFHPDWALESRYRWTILRQCAGTVNISSLASTITSNVVAELRITGQAIETYQEVTK